MSLLYALEKIRLPFFDGFFQIITEFGDETAFLTVALFLFWCVDKRLGYYTLSTCFLGTILNQFLKLAFRIPRPWVQDPNFTIVESARAGATGYSFPSGHTQNSVALFGCIGARAKKTWARVLCIALVILVPFSRLYLGVHTPLDVGVAFASSLLLVFALQSVVYGKKSKKTFPIFLWAMAGLGLAFTLYVEFFRFPGDIDPENLAHGVKNAYTLLGAVLGMLVVYYADEKKFHFSTEAPWYGQVLKLLLGLALVVGLKAGLKGPLLSLFGGHDFAHTLRYFILVLFAGIVWPLTFPWFSKLGKQKKAQDIG